MAAPPIVERHKPHFHRQMPIKESVRAATTASITIATALNNGDSLDGVTLATGDRVLVKNQGTGSQNGIYVVGASPARDYDVSTDDPAFGYLVYVREGTANGGVLFKNTNTTAPTIGTTALTFDQVGAGGTVDIEDEGSAEGAADTIDFTGAGVSVSFAAGQATVDIPGGGTPTFAGARVFNNANIALGNGSETLITFNSERYDTDAYHDTGTNPGRLTIPSGKAGKYNIGANVRVTGSPGDPSYIVITKTTAGVALAIGLQFIANNASIPMGQLSVDWDLAVGDYVQVFVFVNAASKNATFNASYSPEFWLHLIGA